VLRQTHFAKVLNFGKVHNQTFIIHVNIQNKFNGALVKSEKIRIKTQRNHASNIKIFNQIPKRQNGFFRIKLNNHVPLLKQLAFTPIDVIRKHFPYFS